MTDDSDRPAEEDRHPAPSDTPAGDAEESRRSWSEEDASPDDAGASWQPDQRERPADPWHAPGSPRPAGQWHPPEGSAYGAGPRHAGGSPPPLYGNQGY